ncbi:DNA mismatch repair endonuclease MutL [Arachidicoccus terrestris]|uniref:DNA mismatch repair endonuclease MutL n=1 Tax=Arachidicoccus terrestris TaxID=2875539 RepID=UPI001CC7AF1A|nr:DNA mismatch repair endonuclease MutL [Arachidicoccus terrestris]UAY55084.1 DNA mismatch repair endonuclease MutL [Arachidicoccus terrestris]
MDIIRKLPDNIANQIAAGEVIQRPASAVKELMENAIDAGATQVHLVIQDAGKALVQVIDNGKGMSEADAVLSLQRHATSKIQKIEDLFEIKTMGFRGEALASIAAVAEVEIKTRQGDQELGVFIEASHSSIQKKEPCASPQGTSFSMKNLFFNVPARRNFLKSNAAELRHIIEEFTRVALAFPDIFFSLTSNGQEMFHLDIGPLKARIVQLLGSNLKSQLVSVNDETDYINIHGFIGKPEVSKKTRGDQYFFVNNRFIKSAYLNHAITTAFNELIPKENYPLYVLFIDIDPTQVDINVHPTKQEIKFEDEKIIYAFVKAAIKHSLVQSSVAPSLDFSLNAEIQRLDAINKPFNEQNKEAASAGDLYKTFTQKNQAHFIDGSDKGALKNWQDFYKPAKAGSNENSGIEKTNLDTEAKRIADFLQSNPDHDTESHIPDTPSRSIDDRQDNKSMGDLDWNLHLDQTEEGYRLPEDPDGFYSLPTDLPASGFAAKNTNDGTGGDNDIDYGPVSEASLDYFALAGGGTGFGLGVSKPQKTIELQEGAPLLQIQQTYIIAPTSRGYVLVHQQLAHERILYEQFSKRLHKSSGASQKLLIPSELNISTSDGILLEELKDTIQTLGYYIEKGDDQKYAVIAVPADMPSGGEGRAIELLLEQFKHFNSEIRFSKKEKVIRCMARQQAVKAGKLLTQPEMLRLVEDLFACDISALTAAGDSPTYIEFKEDYLDGLFGLGK